MRNHWAEIFVVAIVLFTSANGLVRSYDYSRTLLSDTATNYILNWSFNSTAIQFGLEGRGGWLGIGISPDGLMPLSDIFMGYWNLSVSAPVLYDYKSLSNSRPGLDPQQNLVLVAGKNNGTSITELEFDRLLITGDTVNDIDIDPLSLTWVIWAFRNTSNSTPQSPTAWLQHTYMGSVQLRFAANATIPSPSVSASPTPSPSATPSATPSSSAVPSASSTPSPQFRVPCFSDDDCSNRQGVCVTASVGSYCSCLSGFGGYDCSENPSSFCNTSYSQVDSLSGNFQANTTVNYMYPMLFVNINANSEESIFGSGGSSPSNTPPYSTETLIFFGPTTDDYPLCNYPNGGYIWVDFSAQPGMCYDRYLANMTWNFAKDNCGFVATNGSRSYSQTVTIQRKYNLNGILQRTEQTTRSLNVIFPDEVSVSDSNVTVSFPSSEAFAAITFIDYNPSALVWTVQVQTSISSPYSLGSPSLAFLTGNLAQRTPSISVSTCNWVDTYCVQTITYTYPQGSLSDPCIGLAGHDRHTFQVSCSTSSCPAPSDFNITLSLNTGNACPATDYITFSENSLASYSDSSLSTPTNSFTINDNIWFGASVQTSEALISSRSLKSNSVCFQPSFGPCFYVNYSLETATAGKEPVFVVDLSGPGNAAYFNNITEPTQFAVNAVVQVNFVGVKGLMKNVPQSQTVQTVSHALIGPTDSAMSSSSAIAPFTALILLMILVK